MPIVYCLNLFLTPANPIRPRPRSSIVAGSGTLVTVAFAVVKGISASVESSNKTLEIVTSDVPLPVATKSKLAKIPVPLTPGEELSNVLAIKLIVPVELSITPGMKKVVPPVAKKSPSAIPVLARILGEKKRSNWNPYRSTTSDTFASSVKCWPRFTICVDGSMLTIGIANT